MAEGGALLRRYRGLTSIEGSNPSFSAQPGHLHCARNSCRTPESPGWLGLNTRRDFSVRVHTMGPTRGSTRPPGRSGAAASRQLWPASGRREASSARKACTRSATFGSPSQATRYSPSSCPATMRSSARTAAASDSSSRSTGQTHTRPRFTRSHAAPTTTLLSPEARPARTRSAIGVSSKRSPKKSAAESLSHGSSPQAPTSILASSVPATGRLPTQVSDVRTSPLQAGEGARALVHLGCAAPRFDRAHGRPHDGRQGNRCERAARALRRLLS